VENPFAAQRVQFSSKFGFDQLQEVLPYLTKQGTCISRQRNRKEAKQSGTELAMDATKLWAQRPVALQIYGDAT
jgi:hypothetical protein